MSGGTPATVTEERVAKALDRAGLSYIRSTVVGPYEVDFRLGRKVIIEVDGYSHLTSANRDRDRDKDRYLADLGYTVMRVTGDRVHSELDRFIGEVRAVLKAERARVENDREPSPFAGPGLAALRQKLVDDEAKAAAAKPLEPQPEDDSGLFLDWVGDRVKPPKGKRR